MAQIGVNTVGAWPLWRGPTRGAPTAANRILSGRGRLRCSPRSARMGSIRAARAAGTQPAMAAP